MNTLAQYERRARERSAEPEESLSTPRWLSAGRTRRLS